MNNSLTKITYETTPWAPLTWTSRRSRTPVVRGQADIKSRTRSHPLYEDLPGQKLNPCPGRGVPHQFGSDPAQMVVGKDAYMHRSGGNPAYRVMVVSSWSSERTRLSEGRDLPVRRGPSRGRLVPGPPGHPQRRVSEEERSSRSLLKEYDKGQANWKTKGPAP